MLIAATVFGGEIKVSDSDAPILQIFAMTRKAPDSNQPNIPSFSRDSKPLLTIRSIRDLIIQADGKLVTIVLTERDSKKYAELTRKFQGGLLHYQFSEPPALVAVVGSISAPNENGILYFHAPYFAGDVAEYLRRRFGK